MNGRKSSYFQPAPKAGSNPVSNRYSPTGRDTLPKPTKVYTRLVLRVATPASPDGIYIVTDMFHSGDRRWKSLSDWTAINCDPLRDFEFIEFEGEEYDRDESDGKDILKRAEDDLAAIEFLAGFYLEHQDDEPSYSAVNLTGVYALLLVIMAMLVLVITVLVR